MARIEKQDVINSCGCGVARPNLNDDRLLFGVDSEKRADVWLQNNMNLFEWVKRNKVFPTFWGRNINGNNRLTKDEMKFLHRQGCKIAIIFKSADEKVTEEQGKLIAKQAVECANELSIPKGIAVFLDISDEEAMHDFMRGYSDALATEGYVPAFKANTDSINGFNLWFSRGMNVDREIFEKCLVWATSPVLAEYERITTSHHIHPDNWKPHTPSAISRKDVAVWQYGKDCHPIEDDEGKQTLFNINLVRNSQILIKNMF